MSSVKFEVFLNTDLLPPDLESVKSAQTLLENTLNGMMPLYGPVVKLVGVHPEEVVANPYARHDMYWDKNGSGLCRKNVLRPNGRLEPCNEALDSAIHGGSRDYDLPEQLPPSTNGCCRYKTFEYDPDCQFDTEFRVFDGIGYVDVCSDHIKNMIRKVAQVSPDRSVSVLVYNI